MTAIGRRNEDAIISREKELRDWFTHGKDELIREIDGLDIGWGGSQRWATSCMPDIASGWHLDFACGYGTFLAQLAWRFPCANLFGLNLDYAGPHACIKRLLRKARVMTTLVQADACEMPFAEKCFDSLSCFLGLQDIEIGFGKRGVHKAISEAVRVLRRGGHLILVDEFTLDDLLILLERQLVEVVFRDEYVLDIKWSRPFAEAAIKVYSEGWAVQSRVEGIRERAAVQSKMYMRMKADMEEQLSNRGFYVPHGPVRMVVARKR